MTPRTVTPRTVTPGRVQRHVRRALGAGCCALLLSASAAGVLSAQRDVVRSPIRAPGGAVVSTDSAERGDGPTALRVLLRDDIARRSGGDAVVRERGRFIVVAAARDERLASQLLERALQRDTFPGLPRPRATVLLAVAPDAAAYRAWIGPSAPSWGAAIAFPMEQRIIMQGSSAGAGAGDPFAVLRHELAHLALAEYLGELPYRWFDEGYASVSAGEWGREEALATSIALALKGVPTLDGLERMFYQGSGAADLAYALAHRAVLDLTLRGGDAGFARFLNTWRTTQSFERALRQGYGVTSAGFEGSWRSETRRRYGALALLTNLSLAIGVFALVLGPFVWQRRRRDRARLEAMRRADEAQEEAQRLSALHTMLQLGDAIANPGDGASREPPAPLNGMSAFHVDAGQTDPAVPPGSPGE